MPYDLGIREVAFRDTVTNQQDEVGIVAVEVAHLLVKIIRNIYETSREIL